MGEKLDRAEKIFLTVCFILFMVLFCLGRYITSLCVIFVGIAGFVFSVVLRIKDENRLREHFISNIVYESSRLVRDDGGNSDRAVKFLESELEYCRKDSRISCNENYLHILLASFWGTRGDIEQASEHIGLVKCDGLICDDDRQWLLLYYLVLMNIALKRGENQRAKEIFQELWTVDGISQYENDANFVQMRSEYLLLCGDAEGALREAGRIKGDDPGARMAAFQCRFNALIDLKRYDEAENELDKLMSSDEIFSKLDFMGEFHDTLERKKAEALNIDNEE